MNETAVALANTNGGLDLSSILGITIPSCLSFMTLMAVFFGVWFTRRQLKLNAQQLKLNAFISLLNVWGGKETREDRWYLFNKFTEKDNIKLVSPKERLKVESVLGVCEAISYMARHELIEKNFALEAMGYSMFRCYEKAEWFIKARRREAGELEDRPGVYMYDFEQFFEEHIKGFVELRHQTKEQNAQSKTGNS